MTTLCALTTAWPDTCWQCTGPASVCYGLAMTTLCALTMAWPDTRWQRTGPLFCMLRSGHDHTVCAHHGLARYPLSGHWPIYSSFAAACKPFSEVKATYN